MPKTKITESYLCSICGSEFYDYTQAAKCEKAHANKIELMGSKGMTTFSIPHHMKMKNSQILIPHILDVEITVENERIAMQYMAYNLICVKEK